jgi:Icc-related predicted phosphoesterase
MKSEVMKLWIMSDIHLELSRGWDLPHPAERPDFDVLVMAGDLVPGMERGVEWLAERVTDKPVVYVPGNHEFYSRDIDRTVAKARAAAKGTNVHVLQNDVVDIGEVRFHGATLWTDFDVFHNAPIAMNAALVGMNDYRRIRKDNYGHRLRPVDTLARHLKSRAMIETEFQNPYPRKRVVVTHHGPLRAAMRSGHESDILSAAYVSDMEDVIESYRPELWIFGHTHESVDLTVGRTRVVSNAKGYGFLPENPSFDTAFTIEI